VAKENKLDWSGRKNDIYGKRQDEKFPFIGEIAKPVEPVNDKTNGLRPSLTVPPVFADRQSRRESPKMASRPFQNLEKFA